MEKEIALEKVKELVKKRLIRAYLAFKLTSESDNWARENSTTEPGFKSYLEESWLFKAIHRTAIIELNAIIEKSSPDESAHLSNLKSHNYKIQEIDNFYGENELSIKIINGIRNKYIGHNDINPRVDHNIDSYAVTKVLIEKVAQIMDVNLEDYDKSYQNKTETFAKLCLTDIEKS